MASYKRKTKDATELSEACRRASLSRKRFGGGRPRLAENTRPGRCVRVTAGDYDVLCAFSAAQKSTIKGAVHLLCRLLIRGGTSKPHPDFAPSDWRF